MKTVTITVEGLSDQQKKILEDVFNESLKPFQKKLAKAIAKKTANRILFGK